jgi:predicted HTH transcriptional regulator
MPRNRVLMRIFRDLELMEQLGSGMHRILSIYDSSVFKISEHFFEICFPFERQEGEEWLEVGTDPVTPQVEHLLAIQNGDMSLLEMQELLQLKDRKSFTQLYLHPAMEKGWMEMTIPDKPNSRLQKYRLTEAGRQLQAQLREGSP